METLLQHVHQYKLHVHVLQLNSQYRNVHTNIAVHSKFSLNVTNSNHLCLSINCIEQKIRKQASNMPNKIYINIGPKCFKAHMKL